MGAADDDHWSTAAALADRSPGARVVATAGTTAGLPQAVAARAGFWDRPPPGQVPDSPVTAVPLPGDRLLLEGHELRLVEVGHSDTDGTGVVHVPDLDLVVAGDAVCGGRAPPRAPRSQHVVGQCPRALLSPADQRAPFGAVRDGIGG